MPPSESLISGLFTDFYELTMVQGYFATGRLQPAIFEVFFRYLPFQGGFRVLAGLDTILRALENLSLSGEDLSYPEKTGLFRSDSETGKPIVFHHPVIESEIFVLSNPNTAESLLKPAMKNGKSLKPRPDLSFSRKRTLAQPERLDGSHKQFINPHVYKVSLSESLHALKYGMIREAQEAGT